MSESGGWRVDELTGHRTMVTPPRDIPKPAEQGVVPLELPVGTLPCPFCPTTDGTTIVGAVNDETSRRGGLQWTSIALLNRWPVSFEPDAHEVLVLSPDHGAHFGDLPVAVAASAIDLLIEREAFQHDLGRHTSVFCNHGHISGSSEPHPHAQVIAHPAPNASELQEHDAMDIQRCVLCHRPRPERLVASLEGCHVKVPTAPTMTYEQLVVAEHGHGVRPSPEDLAAGLGVALRALYALVGPVAYNLVFHFDGHPHVHVIPRTRFHAGHDAAGMHVVIVAPEEAAAQLQEALKASGSERVAA